MVERYFRLDNVRSILFLMVVVISGCVSASSTPAEIAKGSTKGEVLVLLGKPILTQDIVIPDEPFFGPQESLVNLVPAGTVIEEWLYEIGEEDLYVWFSGEVGAPREGWLVLVTARYPKDAVY